MDDFFKQFRENLEGRPEPKFDKRDWQSLEKELGQQPGQRRRPVAWWWVAVPFMLLSFGSNVVFYNALVETRKTVSQLETQHDTIYLTKVIRQTDTVFQTKIIHTTAVRYMPATFANTDLSKNNGPLEASMPMVSDQDKLTVGKGGGNTSKSGSAPTESRLHDAPFSPLPLRWMNSTPPKNKVEPTQIALEQPGKKQGKTITQHLYALRPKDFQLSASAGLAFPFNKGMKRKSGHLFSLEASTGLTPHLRLWGEATWFNISFLSSRMGNSIGVPEVTAPSDDYVFTQAESRQPMLQYAFGMQYLFRAKKYLKPSIGLGYGAVSILPYDVSYEFIDPATSLEWNFDLPVNHRALLTNFVVLRAGMEYRLSKQWHWQFGASYRTDLKNKSVTSPQIFGLQSGLKFSF